MPRASVISGIKHIGCLLICFLLLRVALDLWETSVQELCDVSLNDVSPLRGVFEPGEKVEAKMDLFREAVASLLEANNSYELQLPEEWTEETYCEIFQHEGPMSRVVVAGIWRKYMQWKPGDITFVGHATLDRMDVVYLMLHHWSGPVSLSLYVNLNDTDVVYRLYDTYPLLFTKDNVNIHLVLQKGYMYPSSYLRNVALDNAMTENVFLSDTDVICSPEMRERLLTVIRIEGLLSPERKEVLVIPSFETKIKTLPYPQNKTQLLAVWDRNKVAPFHGKGAPNSFLPANFTKWKTATTPYEITYRWGFEPYVVIRKDQAPRYDERMVGKCRDKLHYFFLLNQLGFRFIVLPDVFSIHYPHQPAEMFQRLNLLKSSLYKQCAPVMDRAIQREYTEGRQLQE